jgi:hypothetical protein
MNKSFLNAALLLVQVVRLGERISDSTSMAWERRRDGECEERISHWCRRFDSDRRSEIASQWCGNTIEMASVKSMALSGACGSVRSGDIR